MVILWLEAVFNIAFPTVEFLQPSSLQRCRKSSRDFFEKSHAAAKISPCSVSPACSCERYIRSTSLIRSLFALALDQPQTIEFVESNSASPCPCRLFKRGNDFETRASNHRRHLLALWLQATPESEVVRELPPVFKALRLQSSKWSGFVVSRYEGLI